MANKYDFTPELKQEILKAIFLGRPSLPCTVCERTSWEMADGFATVPLLKNVWTNDRISGLPCAALVCTACGNTLFFNLVALGFKDAIGPDTEAMMKRIAERHKG